MSFGCKLLLQRLDHARFADAGFAGHSQYLALALPREMPAFAHQAHFVGPPDQRQASGADRRKAAFDRGFAAHPPGRHRAAKTLQLVLTGVGQFEKTAQQFLRRFADEDAIRPSQRLQPCGEVGRFTDDGPLLRHAGADDFADHDEASGNADACLHARAFRRFDGTDFRQNSDRGTNGAFRGILEGMGKAEIGQHAIAHEFGDEPAVAPDRACHRVLVSPDYAAQKLRIELRRQRRGADHIGEHHSHLPPLGFARAGRLSCGRSFVGRKSLLLGGNRGCCGVTHRNRLQKPAPIAQ